MDAVTLAAWQTHFTDYPPVSVALSRVMREQVMLRCMIINAFSTKGKAVTPMDIAPEIYTEREREAAKKIKEELESAKFRGQFEGLMKV